MKVVMVMTEIQNEIKINKHAIHKTVQHSITQPLKVKYCQKKSHLKLQSPEICLSNTCKWVHLHIAPEICLFYTHTRSWTIHIHMSKFASSSSNLPFSYRNMSSLTNHGYSQTLNIEIWNKLFTTYRSYISCLKHYFLDWDCTKQKCSTVERLV